MSNNRQNLTIDCELRCDRCGADLRGADTSSCCPGCGRRVAEMIDPTVIEPGRMVVSSDVPCVGCEYNLRTLLIGGLCPECATPVAASLRPGGLQFADVRWLRRVRSGITLMLAAAIGLMLVLLFVVFGLWAGRAPVMVWLIVLLPLLVAVLWCWGVFEATSREPNRRYGADRRLVRFFTRLLAVIPVVGWLLFVAIQLLGPFLGMGMWGSRVNTVLIFVLFYVCPFISPMMICVYFRPIGTRGHRPQLRRLNTVLICLLAAGQSVIVALIVAQLGFEAAIGPGYLLPVLAIYLVCFVLGIVGFVGHRRMFSRALAGRSAWHEHGPGGSNRR